MERKVGAYGWRELTEGEYAHFKTENMVFYRALSVIISFFYVAVVIIGIVSFFGIISREDMAKNIATLIFSAIAGYALYRGHKYIKDLGLNDIRTHNLVACDGTFVRLEERTRGRNGTTRFDYYAIVRMPDDGELAVECTLSEADNKVAGDPVTVVRPRDSYLVQRMSVLM